MVDATEQARMVRDGGGIAGGAGGRRHRSTWRELNPHLNAVIHPLLEDEAHSDGGRDRLPGRAIPVVFPFLVKDLSCYMKGAPVHKGIASAAGTPAIATDHDMWLARRLPGGRVRDPGAHQRARAGDPSPPRSPSRTARRVTLGPSTTRPGGSSGGSASCSGGRTSSPPPTPTTGADRSAYLRATVAWSV